MTFRIRSKALALAALLAASLAGERSAEACGGLFCSAVQPVNQAAERIIFVQNDDETVTAVIQIMYQGPSTDFSWLLPISTVPKANEDIGIASDIAFQRLQAATNPQYSLTTRIEGTCRNNFARGAPQATSAPATGGNTAVDSDGPGSPPVVVEATGTVGAFEWAVISLDASLADPAGAAKVWLEDNGYDVSPGAEALIGPYLKDGLYLLALKLKKGSDTGSIRPIVLTYAAARPMIPIKLTAVAANDDMGVMTWVLGKHRAIPRNYRALELNEARINWFNAGPTYNDVVTEAADEAGGRGFVTEFADRTDRLANVIWTQFDEQSWQALRNGLYGSFGELFGAAHGRYSGFSGFWDAVRESVTLPENVPFDDFKACPSCYQDQISFSPTAFWTALEKQVVEPVRGVQELFDRSNFVTRFYSTLSAGEMTEDPLFGFNSNLPTVSNLHQAERVIRCSSGVDVSEAPWYVTLPQGGTVHGSGLQAQQGIWPGAVEEQPPNRLILQLSESGSGSVVLDNTAQITQSLSAGVGSNASAAADSGSEESEGGCSIGHGSGASAWALLAFLGAAAARRSTRRKLAAKRPA